MEEQDTGEDGHSASPDPQTVWFLGNLLCPRQQSYPSKSNPVHG